MLSNERVFVRIMHEIACELGIEYKSFVHDWVIKLSKNGESRVIVGYGFPLNSAPAASVCTDKAAASALMADCGIPCVHHRFFMNPCEYNYTGGYGNWAELTAMLADEQKLVCKPNEGTCGRQVYRVSDLPSLENAMTRLFSSNRGVAVCRYYDIYTEHRVILLDGQTLIAYEKKLPFVTGDGRSTVAMLTAEKYLTRKYELSMPSHIPALGEQVNVGWKHNLDEGATPELVNLSDPFTQRLAKLAADAAAACGVRFASVDIINADMNSSGLGPLVLEINSGVMMENFAAIDNTFYNMAKDVYRKAILAMW